jgi:hypothetical protein
MSRQALGHDIGYSSAPRVTVKNKGGCFSAPVCCHGNKTKTKTKKGTNLPLPFSNTVTNVPTWNVNLMPFNIQESGKNSATGHMLRNDMPSAPVTVIGFL